jgi:betaine lipid synthase
MLGLVAAQLKHRCEAGLISQRPVWVDVSTSLMILYNTNKYRLAVEPVTSERNRMCITCTGLTSGSVEQMGKFVSVPEFFRSVCTLSFLLGSPGSSF